MTYLKYFGIIVFAFLFSSFSLFPAKSAKLQLSNKEKLGFYKTSYGLLPNNTLFIKNIVHPNEYVSNVFSKFDLNGQQAFEVSTYSDSIFDPRRFKSGNSYIMVLAKEGNSFKPKQFIYEKNVIEYAVFNFDNDQIVAEVKSKPIVRKRVVSSAVIKGSLYQTLLEIGANPLFAIELSEIYKWTIDFYRIQENDFFKAIYYEEFVEGQSIGEFEIEAASFSHLGIESKAFAYMRADGDKREYFDEEGFSMKEFFLQAPVAYSRISSSYSPNRFHPVTGVNKPHLGTDYAAPTGTPIYSTANGVITEAKYKQYNGNYVKIKHNDTYTTQYLHMSKIASGIKPGVRVEQGQIIGYVGSTGLATGPHVCYRFWKNGKQVDPYKENIAKANPLSKEEIPAYLEFIAPLHKKLNQLSLHAI